MGILRGSLLGVLICLLAFSIVPSCRSVVVGPGIDKEIKPYVNQFLKYCHQYEKNCSDISNYRIQLDDMTALKVFFPGVVGACTRADKTIVINKHFWKEESPARREQLVFHELGHCILELDHVQPEQIHVMNPSVLPGNVYLMFYSILQNELFGCKKDCPVVKFDKTRYTK